MRMKIFTTGLIIISTLVMASIALTPSTALQASSKGLKLYLTIDTNLNDDVRINTYQHGDIGSFQLGTQQAPSFSSPSFPSDQFIDEDSTTNDGPSFEDQSLPLTQSDEDVLIEPNDISALNDKGSELVDLGRYDESIIYFDRSLAMDPNDAYTLNNKGHALYLLGKYDEAMEYFHKALAIDSTDAYALARIGDVLNQQLRYDEAIAYYDKALAIDPNNSNTLSRKGDALHSLAKYDEAITYFDRALAIEPENAYTLAIKGDALNQLSKYDEAIEYFNKALVINSTNTYSLFGKGVWLDYLNRTEEAIAYYDKALAINSTDTDVLNHKGFSLINLGRIDEALTYLDKALLIDPNHAFALDTKGYGLYKLGRYEEAITYLDRALAIDPTFTEALHDKDLVLQVIREGNLTTMEEGQQQQQQQQPRRIAYGLPEGDTPFLRLFHERFEVDNITVNIVIDPSTYEQSSKYIEVVKAGINKWSELLKQYSGNHDAWNFNIITETASNNEDTDTGTSAVPISTISTTTNIPPTDIVIEVRGDPQAEECDLYGGVAFPHPHDLHEVVQSKVLTSCGQQEYDQNAVYGIVLHEFGHNLGLGHAYKLDGDLMCSADIDERGERIMTCDPSDSGEAAELSDEDINAVLFKYGKDGFAKPNRTLEGEKPFYLVGTPVD